VAPRLVADAQRQSLPDARARPIAQCMDINRGNRFDFLVSMSSNHRGLEAYAAAHFAEADPRRHEAYKLGDVNVTLIRTVKGQTIYVGHNTNTARPTVASISCRARRGSFKDGPTGSTSKAAAPRIRGRAGRLLRRVRASAMEIGARAVTRTAGHGGMDFWRIGGLIQCLRAGQPTDQNVYDAAAWSSIVDLTQRSVASRGAAQDGARLHRGKWQTTSPLSIVEVDRARAAPPIRTRPSPPDSSAGCWNAFDFFLVVMTLTAIGKEFHKSDAAIAFSITLTLLFRPVGAFIFGLPPTATAADPADGRFGVLLDRRGADGPGTDYVTFLVLRALFGIGMGAEWGVGASLVMERVPPRLRGIMSGLLQQGYAAGYLLAALCYLVVFPHWGWRPLFFIGGLPALLALFVRARVHESDVWRETRHKDWAGLGRAIASNWKLFLYLTCLMALMNMVSHGTQDMYPTFLERDWGWGPTARAALTAFSQVGALAGGVLCGLYSDRLGRRRTIGLALAERCWRSRCGPSRPPPPLLVLGAFVMQFFVQGAWGVIPAHIHRARAGRRPGLPAGLRLSVRRGDREPNPPRAGAVRGAYELRADHGALGGAGVHRVRGGGDPGPGATAAWPSGAPLLCTVTTAVPL